MGKRYEKKGVKILYTRLCVCLFTWFRGFWQALYTLQSKYKCFGVAYHMHSSLQIDHPQCIFLQPMIRKRNPDPWADLKVQD